MCVMVCVSMCVVYVILCFVRLCVRLVCLCVRVRLCVVKCVCAEDERQEAGDDSHVRYDPSAAGHHSSCPIIF